MKRRSSLFCILHLQVIAVAAQAEYGGAVKSLLSVVQEAERIPACAILSRAFNELGVISYNRNELPQALGYYGQALFYNDRNPQSDQARAYANINIAMVHGRHGCYDSALYYLALAGPICEQLENLFYLAKAYAVEAEIYKWSGRYPPAEAAMLKMVALRAKTEDSIIFSDEQLGLPNFYGYAKMLPLLRQPLSAERSGQSSNHLQYDLKAIARFLS